VVPPVRPRSVDVAGRGFIEVTAPRRPAGRWKGFPISLSLRDAPLPEVLRSFARLAGFNLVLDPRVQGEVTVELKDVPWDQALHVILKTHGMGAEVDGRVWLVEPR
jgi:type IV pilus assembly protein PilQ